MGMDVKVTLNPNAIVEFAAARRRGVVKAGAQILAMSSERAPYDEHSKHEVHMRDTGRVELIVEEGVDSAAIAYSAFYAARQHEDLAYHHEHGEAKFLERSLIEGHESALAVVAATIREVTGS